jgi:hypothetical protein
MHSNRTEKMLLVAAGCAAGLLGCLTLAANHCGICIISKKTTKDVDF